MEKLIIGIGRQEQGSNLYLRRVQSFGNELLCTNNPSDALIFRTREERDDFMESLLLIHGLETHPVTLYSAEVIAHGSYYDESQSVKISDHDYAE